MIVLRIRARNVADVMGQGYDTIQVYRDTSATGLFSASIGTIPLITGQENYSFTDPGGTASNWYVVTYLRVAAPPPSVSETEKSSPVRGVPTTGPLGFLTVGYVQTTTDIPQIANLPADKVGELIVISEVMIQNFAALHCGLNPNAENYDLVMPILARMVLEEIYLRASPASRSRAASGLASERIGNYSYTTRADSSGSSSNRSALTDEIKAYLQPFTNCEYNTVQLTTTQVFTQVVPTINADGSRIVPWNDVLDVEIDPRIVNTRIGPKGELIGPVLNNWLDTWIDD
jgi:hypothetical protein